MKIKMKLDKDWCVKFLTTKFKGGQVYRVPQDLPLADAEQMVNHRFAEVVGDVKETDEVPDQPEVEEEGEENEVEKPKKKEDMVPENKAITGTEENK